VIATPEVIPPLLGAVGVATVGVVVSGRRPGHPVGWLLLGFGLSLSAAGVALAYTSYGVARAGTPPASPLDLSVLEGGPLIAYQAAFAVVILANLAAAASLVARFRRARGSERQQLRWVMLGTVVVALLSLVNLAALALGAFALAPLVGGLNPLVLAAAVGAAILRYRLYDLDRIVSRTLAYGLLTVLLGVVDQTVEPTRASFWTLPRPYQEAKTRAWPPEPSS
jgi:hypothetical protein